MSDWTEVLKLKIHDPTFDHEDWLILESNNGRVRLTVSDAFDVGCVELTEIAAMQLRDKLEEMIEDGYFR